MVYVLNIEGKPLMPCTEAKARKLLKQEKAKIVKYEPFIIQLLFECDNITQDITLGVDAGSKYIGLSATTNKLELYSAEVEMRTDIVKLLATRKNYRNNRRSRKTRYRQARFLNRKKDKGWLAPSIHNKINTHLRMIENIHKILPITKIIVEVASFDIQKIKNPEISGKEYQEGEQLNFWNVREYVLFRDGHRCHGKSGCKNKILNIHHIESRKTGGNTPNNLITLCQECHSNYHQGKLKLNFKRGKSFKDTTFMGIMRWSFYNKLKELYKNVNLTYGYITKNTRILNNLPKSHRIDALCITKNINIKRLENYYKIKQVRKKKRSLHEAIPVRGRKHPNITQKRNKKNTKQLIYKGLTWCLRDKVRVEDKIGFITGFTGNNAYVQNISRENLQILFKFNIKNIIFINRNNNYINHIDSNKN